MLKYALLAFANRFMYNLSILYRRTGGELEKFLEKVYDKYGLDDEIPPGSTNKKEIIRTVISRTRKGNAQLKYEQREFFKTLEEHIVRFLSKKGINNTIDNLPGETFVQLATGSGKTLIYTFLAYYYIIAERINPKKRRRVKFVIATWTNAPEGVQVLKTLFAFKLALLAMREMNMRLPILGRDEPLSDVPIDNIFIGRYQGADNTPCLANAIKHEFAFYDATRTLCLTIRANDKCPYNRIIRASDILGESASKYYQKSADERRRVLLYEFRDMCPLLQDVVYGLFADIVVTNHAVIKQALSDDRLSLATLVLSSKNFEDEDAIISKTVRYLLPRLKNEKSEQYEPLRRRLERFLDGLIPDDTVLIIDEADRWLSELHIEASLRIHIENVGIFSTHLNNLYKIISNNEDLLDVVKKFRDEFREPGSHKIIKEILDNKSQKGREKDDKNEKIKNKTKAKILLSFLLLPGVCDDTIKNELIAALTNTFSYYIYSNTKEIINNLEIGYNDKLTFIISGDRKEDLQIKRMFICSVLGYLREIERANQELRRIRAKMKDYFEELQSNENIYEDLKTTLKRIDKLARIYYGVSYKVNRLIPLQLGSSPATVCEIDSELLKGINIYVQIHLRDGRIDSIDISFVKNRDPRDVFYKLAPLKKFFFSATFPRLMIALRLLFYDKKATFETMKNDPSKYSAIIIDEDGRREYKDNIKIYVYKDRLTTKLYRDEGKISEVRSRIEALPAEVKKLLFGEASTKVLFLRPAKRDVSLTGHYITKQFKKARGENIHSLILSYESIEDLIEREHSSKDVIGSKIKSIRDLIKTLRDDSRKCINRLKNKSRLLKQCVRNVSTELKTVTEVIPKNAGAYTRFIEPFTKLMVGEYSILKYVMDEYKISQEYLKEFKIVYEGLVKSMLLEHLYKKLTRLLIIDILHEYIRSGSKKEPALAMATGAFSRGLDLPELNVVILGRMPIPETSPITRHNMRRFRGYNEASLEEQVHLKVLDQLLIDAELDPLFKEFKARSDKDARRLRRLYVSNRLMEIYTGSEGIRQAVQAIGRLTRGKGKKIGIILDGRFIEFLKTYNELRKKAFEKIAKGGYLVRIVELSRGLTHDIRPLKYIEEFVVNYGQ